MKVAIVIDWLVVYAGAERVIEQILNCYPTADIFSIVDFIPDSERSFLLNKVSITSFIQKLPFAKKKYRFYLPLMPYAIEQFDLSSYELVISSSHSVAKGVITGPDQLHICMCYSPVRYAWDLQFQYLKESGMAKGIKGFFTRYFLHKIRLWDTRTSNGVDEFIAISKFIARRINKVYRRDSTIIYPPVNIEDFKCGAQHEDFYLTASRMVPYKRIDLIVDSFNQMPSKNLIIIGDGPDLEKIKSKANINIKVMGYQTFEVLRDHMQRAKAFVFAAEEDFGIVPIEAQACGTPVIAYGKGGALETIVNLDCQNPTGVFFNEQSIESIVQAVKKFEDNIFNITEENCRGNALRFSTDRFKNELSSFIDSKYRQFDANLKVT